MPITTSLYQENHVDHSTLAVHTRAVEQAIEVMHTHIQEALTLEDLASTAYLSPYHFHHIFRRLIGVPPGEFLSALRLQVARHLLLTTPLSVTDICFEVGYSSTGSFTSRFTRLVGLSPRSLRQRAHAFEPRPHMQTETTHLISAYLPTRNTLRGRISTPGAFQGTIYVALFLSPIPQGGPVRCTKLSTPGTYVLNGIADGIYYLRAAAFPASSDLRSSLVPGEKMLLGSNLRPLVICNGLVSGDPDLLLHPPLLTDPPLVMGLPLL